MLFLLYWSSPKCLCLFIPFTCSHVWKKELFHLYGFYVKDVISTGCSAFLGQDIITISLPFCCVLLFKTALFILLSGCVILSLINWNLPQRNHSDPLSYVGSWADQYFSRNPMFVSVDITRLLTFQIVIFLPPAVLFSDISFCVHLVVLESHAGLFQPI